MMRASRSLSPSAARAKETARVSELSPVTTSGHTAASTSCLVTVRSPWRSRNSSRSSTFGCTATGRPAFDSSKRSASSTQSAKRKRIRAVLQAGEVTRKLGLR